MKKCYLSRVRRLWRFFVLAGLFGGLSGMLYGQASVLPAGARAANASGTLDFSVGQIDYSFYSDSMGFQLSGVQQPEVPARVDTLDCKGYSLANLEFPYMKTPYSNELRLDYSGGNGRLTPSVVFASLQVSGLTLSLKAQKLSKGKGSVLLGLSGKADTTGVARFQVRIGGKTCTLEIQVQDSSASLDSLLCSKYKILPDATLRMGTPFDGQVKLPYQGGNKLKIPSFELFSEGIRGLVLSSDSVTLGARSGDLAFRLKGVPDTSGTVVFRIAIGGQSCTLRIPVDGPPLAVPNFFSPNQDGIQDIWTVPLLFEDYPDAEIRIIDRSGKRIAFLNKEMPFWDGTFEGSTVSPGVYWAHILVADGKKPITSSITLLR